MKTVSIWSTKGGVGKTTLTVHLADGLTQEGARVLVVDLDPQRSMSRYARFAATKGALGFEVVAGYPSSKPAVDYVIVDHPPAHEIDNKPRGNVILIPFLPGPLDWWAATAMLKELSDKERERVRMIANMITVSRREEGEALDAIKPAAMLRDRSIYRRAIAHGGSVYRPGDLPPGAYGLREARAEMSKILDLVR